MKLIRHTPHIFNRALEAPQIAQSPAATDRVAGERSPIPRLTRRRKPWWQPGTLGLLTCLLTSLLVLTTLPLGLAQPVAATTSTSPSSNNQPTLLVARTLERLAMGDAFDAKLRQRIWVGGREVVGIGRYEQSGEGSGRLSLEMTIHDGDSRHELRQISDGKLAWFRSQVGEEITLRRVDVGRIKEIHQELTRPIDPLLGKRQVPATLTSTGTTPNARQPAQTVPPWLRVGGLAELLDTVAQDYDLRLTHGKVDDAPVWILRGVLRADARTRILQDRDPDDWPTLGPHEVRLAIAASGDESGFGIGLPVRIEFWSEPPREPPVEADGSPKSDPDSPASSDNRTDETSQAPANRPRVTPDTPSGRLISLLEIYAVRKIRPSPEQRFRFEREERDVSFSNDTRRYLDRLESSSRSIR
ncbi:MAG: hypothetical protein EA381_09170 [Planctomycetaceae bacterium]|nr:MAG: hypothetical protein EA381_09170 [Planctomycetaceae bacterium]